MRWVSVASDGTQAAGWLPALSADGRYIAYSSDTSSIVANDTNAVGDIFLASMW